MMSGGGGGMNGGGFGNGQYDMFGKRKRRSANVSTLILSDEVYSEGASCALN